MALCRDKAAAVDAQVHLQPDVATLASKQAAQRAVSATAAAARAHKEAQAALRIQAVRQCLAARNVIVDNSANSPYAEPIAAAPPIPVPERGVSLHWLRTLAQSLLRAGLPEDASTEYMVSRYLQPLLRSPTPTCSKNCSNLWDSIPQEHVGKPDHYIVYAWEGGFQSMVKAVSDKLDPPALPNMPPPPPVNAKAIYVWLDFAVVAQNPGDGQALLETGIIREAISGCKNGSLVVIDASLAVLRRAWCLMEVFYTAYLLQVDKLHVLLPESLELGTGMQLQTAILATDLLKAQAARPEDKMQIVREVKRAVGMQKMQQLVAERLCSAVRVALRWGGLERLAVYSALLLQKSEFGLLYMVLSFIPELQVEDVMLEEILTLFKLYDTDGSGELDEDEFVKALGAAGISAAEASEMYANCNADGGDGVSIEEFEKWWIDNQGGATTNGNNPQDNAGLIMDNLLHLLEGFAKLLQRSGLERHADHFLDWADQLDNMAETKLTMPPTRGDWKAMLEQMNWKLANDDVKGGAKLLYHFLIGNAELCSTDLALVPVFDASLAPAQLYKPIEQYLDLMKTMLKWYPGRKKEASMLHELARKYRLLSARDSEQRLPSLTHIRAKQMKKKWQKSDKFIFNIISKMVHLKYGEQHAMGPKVIDSAMKALSRWMAMTRKQNDYDAICQFSADYLADLDLEASDFPQISARVAGNDNPWKEPSMSFTPSFDTVASAPLWDMGVGGSPARKTLSMSTSGAPSASLPSDPFLPPLLRKGSAASDPSPSSSGGLSSTRSSPRANMASTSLYGSSPSKVRVGGSLTPSSSTSNLCDSTSSQPGSPLSLINAKYAPLRSSRYAGQSSGGKPHNT